MTLGALLGWLCASAHKSVQAGGRLRRPHLAEGVGCAANVEQFLRELDSAVSCIVDLSN